jgi:hypothetical protein
LKFLPLFILPQFVKAIANLTREHEFVIEEVLNNKLFINDVVHTAEVPLLKLIGIEYIHIVTRIATKGIRQTEYDSHSSRILGATLTTFTDYIYKHIVHFVCSFLVDRDIIADF